MRNVNELLYINVTADQLHAEICYNEENLVELIEQKFTKEDINHLLQENDIIFGIKQKEIDKLLKRFSFTDLPITIAEGKDKIDGNDGKIEPQFDTSIEVDRSEGWDFREVMRIPSVNEGEKLAKLIPPTKGENGMSVFGKEITAKPGRPLRIKAGKNVTFNEQDQCFYSTASGQVNFGTTAINVFPVYEVFEDISMKTGNIDFVGSVIIRGDVPTGFTVKAAGDIKIFGLVEAASIVAEGSIFISEGLAGLKSGTVQAGENVHIGYINQGIVRAQNSIHVDNSILHSECTATNDIICKKGNIIGGKLSAGGMIKAKDIGNRMNTTTELAFGVDMKVHEKKSELEFEKEKLTDNLQKLDLLRQRLSKQHQNSKTRITLLKLRHSYTKTKEQLTRITDQLYHLNDTLGNVETACLYAKGTVYSNVIVSFGKYKRVIDRNFDHVRIRIMNNEINIGSY